MSAAGRRSSRISYYAMHAVAFLEFKIFTFISFIADYLDSTAV